MQEWAEASFISEKDTSKADNMATLKSMSLADWEKHGIQTALYDSRGNISMAAKKLGITRTTLYKKIDRFGLSKMGERSVLA